MRSEKKAIDGEVREQIGASSYLYVVDYRGMKVAQLDALRQRLRRDHARFRVFKNTFLRRASSGRGWTPDFGAVLKGMLGIVVGEDPVTAARALKEFSAEHKAPVVRGGILEDRPLTADQIAELASLPGREELLGMFVGTLAAPMSGLVGVLNAVPSGLARVLKAAMDKKSAASA